MSSRFEQPLLPGILLGIGLGGFVDGIVLHQILQWHHLLTSQGDYPATTVAGLETNTLWDGLFHASTWIACVVGLALLWRGRGGAPPGRALFGQMLAGWGLFNVVEGLVDHQLLGIHHVKTDAAGNAIIALDIAFLVFGAALVATGAALARRRAYSPASGLR